MKRVAVWAAIFTICGIYLRLGRSELVCLVSFLFLPASLFYFVIKTRNRNYFLFLFFGIVGFLLAGHSAEKATADTSFFGAITGEGIVREAGQTSAGNQELFMECDVADGKGNHLEDVDLYAVWSGEERFREGDQVSFAGKLTPFYNVSVPDGYDEELYLRTEGCEGKIYPEEMEYLGEDHSLFSCLARARGKVHATLDSILPANESGIMKAMLTGDKEDIPEENYELYVRAGVVHVLCISGLHMSILSLYVSYFVEKILKQTKRVSAAVTMLASLFFLLFIGFTPSAVRAVVMICVVMMARILFRSHDRLNEISIAALLILYIEPLYLFHIGFQLSFVTVLGLCVAADRTEQKRRKDRIWKDALRESLVFSLYGSLFSFPLVAYYFHYISLAGILANLIIIPLSGLLLGLGMLSAFLGMLRLSLGVFAAGSVYGILQIFETTCTLLLQLPFAYILVGRPTELVIFLYYGLLFFWLKYAERKGSWKGALLLSIMLWCAVFENQFFRKETTVTFLDVGQGDAAVIHTWEKKTYLVDGGGIYGKALGENVGNTILLPYLESLGVSEIEAAFLSHPDNDHMTGLLEIMEYMPIKRFYLGEYPYEETSERTLLKETLEKYHTTLYTVDNGSHTADGTWVCLAPVAETSFSEKEDNHGSMVLKYTVGQTAVLFTGDMTDEEERLLLEKDADVSADILKVSHHGSRYSSDENFLAAVDAKSAVISCGEGNIYGHPHKETLERLAEAGAEIYRTDVCGSVQIKLKQDGTFTIETMAERKPLYERIKETVEKR